MKSKTILNKNQEINNSNQNAYIELINKLNSVSIGAVSELYAEAYKLPNNSLKFMSRLHTNLTNLYLHKRDKNATDMLHMIYSIIGSDYADAIIILHKNIEARNHFLYEYISNLGELINELTE